MRTLEGAVFLIVLAFLALAMAMLLSGCVTWPDCEREVSIKTKCEAAKP